MKFILMMNATRASEDMDFFTWTPEEQQAHMACFRRLNDELRKTGELVAVEALARPALARIVKAGKTGEPIVSDGPFAESKEFLAGYWIVDVENAERAYEIAARASAAPGRGGKPLNMPLEVREVMSLSAEK
jgi:hypothetical protein